MEEKRNLMKEISYEDGMMQVSNLEQATAQADMMIKSGLLPKSYQNSSQVLAAMHFAKELNLPPMVALRQISVINGTPSVWGDLPMALVQKTGNLADLRQFFVDDNMEEICSKNKNLKSEVYAAICRMKRVGMESWNEAFFTMDEAKRAGLSGKGVWRQYPKDMMKYKAVARCIKIFFSDCLYGASIQEHDFHTTGDQGDQKELKIVDAEDFLG